MLLLLTSLFFLALIYLVRNLKNRRLPPGPFRFPVIGSIPQIVMADNIPHRAFYQLAQKYGDLMSVGMGVHYMVIVSSYEYIKELFSMTDVSNRFPLPIVKDRNFGKENMGIILSDSLDIKHYTVKKLKDLGFLAKTLLDPIFQQESSELISSIRQNIKSDGTWKVDMDLLSVSTLNISWAFMAGFRFSFDNPLLLKTMKATETVIQAVGFNNKYTAFPFLKTWFPNWSGHVDHMMAYAQLHGLLRQLVNEIKETDGNSQLEESFIRRYLKEIKNADELNKHMFNEEQLIVILSDMFLAGSETASNSINWILLHFCLYPEVQEKVYEEFKRVIGKDGLITLADEKEMPYTKAVMYETMRVACFIPMGFPRIASRDIEIGGYLIPKGSGLTYNLTGVFNDKKYWGDPEAFRPERFIEFDEVGVPRKLKGIERMIQFGVGKRICPGEVLGISNVVFIIATLIQEFKFSVIPGKIPSTVPVCEFTVRPENYSLKVENREK